MRGSRRLNRNGRDLRHAAICRQIPASANGEVAERSKALDWNSSNISTGVRGFESHPLRQLDCDSLPIALTCQPSSPRMTQRV